MYQAKQYCARSNPRDFTLVSTYLFNKENYNSVSQPCISKDYVINVVLIAVVFYILTHLHYTNLRGTIWRLKNSRGFTDK